MLIITIFVYLATFLWVMIFLARARDEALPLPKGTSDTPEYALWLPDTMPIPLLEPPPHQLFEGPEVPSYDGYILRLAKGVVVPSNLPARCFSTGLDFLSVLVRPSGNGMGRFYERMRRDFAQAAWVNEVKHPAAFVDPRCVWFRGVDFILPSSEQCPVFRIGRARKAHGLPVGLFAGYETGDDAREISAPSFQWPELEHEISEWFRPQPAIRWLIAFLSVLMWWVPLVALFHLGTRDAAILALTLGVGQRLCAALYDGFSGSFVLLAPFLEPLFWMRVACRYEVEPIDVQPELSGWNSPESIAPIRTDSWPWLNESMFVHSARKLGGSAMIMDLLYANNPQGFSVRGKMLDRWIHQLPAARAVRFRRYAIEGMLRSLRPSTRLISLPSGTGRDLVNLAFEELLLVDMDAEALRIAAQAIPQAQTLQASFQDLEDNLKCDAFVYCGLSEYLGDHEVSAQLRQIKELLSEGGLLITSTTQLNQQMEMMSRYIGWRTRARSAKEYRGHLEAAGFRVVEQCSDPNDIQVVFAAEPMDTF